MWSPGPSHSNLADNFSRYPNFDNWKNGSKKISSRLRTIFNNNNKDTLVKFDGLHSGRGYIEPRYYYK